MWENVFSSPTLNEVLHIYWQEKCHTVHTGNFIQYKWGSSVHIVTDGYMASMSGNNVNLFPHVYSLLFTQFKKFNHGKNVFPWTAYAASSPVHHVK
jgi:hypothetical protein